MARVKKNDNVILLSGQDKGKIGVVIDILPKKGKVMVKGCRIQTRHVKARKQGDSSGIKKQEAYLALSNVMPVCSVCNKPCRVNAGIAENGKKVRTCNRCKKVI